VIEQLLQDNSLGQHITAMKVWDTSGKIVYATESRDIGLTFPIDSDLMHALHGWVASDIRILDKPENIYDKDRGKRRLVAPVQQLVAGRRAQQVEVRSRRLVPAADEPVDCKQASLRRHHETRPAGAGRNRAIGPGDGFESADDRRADGDHPATPAPGRVEQAGGPLLARRQYDIRGDDFPCGRQRAAGTVVKRKAQHVARLERIIQLYRNQVG